MTAKRAFIVEDETIVRMHLAAILPELGWEVTGSAATSGEVFERLAAAETLPDLVLMDVRIPGDRDGIEVARELRRTHGVPSVFVTAYADDETIRRVQEVGGLGYLVKPFSRAEIGAVLATALGQSQLLRRLAYRSRSLQAVLENAADPVLVLDEAGRVIGMNERAAHLTGWTPEEALEHPLDEVLRFDRRGAIFADNARSALDLATDPLTASMDVIARDGRRHTVTIDVATLHDARGLPSGSLVVLHAAPGPGDAAPSGAGLHALPAAAPHDAMLAQPPRFHDLVGMSPAMRHVFAQIQELSRVEWNVLVEGETGTGKELVARAIHAASPRHDGPFVAINCAGLTDSLLASQLFGHRRGAFTGAVRDQPGLFETAHGGTLLLDEIGDVSPRVQKTLLRVLEEKRITRLGDPRPRQVDVRLIAASQHDLDARVRSQRFRADLLFRLRVARIELPPLRERREDIPLLAHWFLSHSRKAVGKSIRGITSGVLDRLVAYTWPGNVRELKSAIEYAALACRGETLLVQDLPREISVPAAGSGGGTTSEPAATRTHGPEQNERQRILEALERTHGNRTQAARLMGISRATLYRRLAGFETPPSGESKT